MVKYGYDLIELLTSARGLCQVGSFEMAKHFQCDLKILNKTIQNKTLFKMQWYVKFDDK